MSRKVVITGAYGFLGWHLRCRFAFDSSVSAVVAVGREHYGSAESLAAAVKGADVIVHAAGINRDSDEALEQGNISLAEALCRAMSDTGFSGHLIYANSIHRDRDNAYGRGKRGAGECLREFLHGAGARYTELVLPQLFGECGRPFYNSAVFSFCQHLVDGSTPEINPDGMLELLHAQDVAARCLSIIEEGQEGDVRPEGVIISVPELYQRLKALHERYVSGVIPPLAEKFDLQLFNMLRTFLYPEFYPRALTLNTDERGSLFEAVKTDHGGQAFLSTTKSGVTRGNHFHFSKVERFLVVQGEAVIRIRKLFSDEVREFKVAGGRPVFVDMPPLHTHSIENTGEADLMTLFWSHEIFDPDSPDTVFEPVLGTEGKA